LLVKKLEDRVDICRIAVDIQVYTV
jgi:hypothetical protein